MLNDIEIKLKTNFDFSAIKSLYAEVRESKEYLPIINDFRKATEGEVIYEVWAEDYLVGFASIWTEDFFIHHFYIRPECQGKGIGKQLLNHLKLIYPTSLSLKCLLANTSALQFYLQNDFAIQYQDSSVDSNFAFMLWKGSN